MGSVFSKTGKKKLSVGKIVLWVLGIFVVLQIISGGELFEDIFGSVRGGEPGDTTPATEIVYKTYMGITAQDTQDGTGILVESVEPGGPAEAAGILEGDIITGLGTYTVAKRIDLELALIIYDPWETVDVALIRNGVPLTLSITFAEKAEVVTIPQEDATQPQGGTPPQQVTTPPQASTPPQQVTTPPQDSTGNQGNTGSTEVHDRLPSMPAELRNHVLLGSRDSGISATFTGDVLITVIFVNDPTSTWTAEKIASTKAGDAAMTAEVLAEAASYGANLNITMEYRQATVNTTEEADAGSWAEQIMASAGLGSVATASGELERTRGVKEAPILFYVNATERSYAQPNGGGDTEYAIIWNCGSDTITYRHELFHLFGAADLYMPRAVEECAQRYYPNSTMLTGENSGTDNLTAYLIGWTDTLTDDALAFLRETAYVTPEIVAQEYDKETHTGYVENWEKYGDYLTGYLDFGILEGPGKIVYQDGSWYEGNFVFGAYDGQGKLVYANGAWFEGVFENGSLVSGRCKVVYESGGWYEGDMDQGAFNGQGTMVWPGGDTYTGQWKDNQYHGNGKITYANGGWYEGDFANGVFNGQGTIVWANGDSYTGGFLNGNLHGYGTYTGADGNSVSGTWENGIYIG